MIDGECKCRTHSLRDSLTRSKGSLTAVDTSALSIVAYELTELVWARSKVQFCNLKQSSG